MRASLEHILGLVTDDLRFAETKNAALLTANAATVIGIGQLFASHLVLGRGLLAYLAAILLAGTVSGVCGLVSFIPGARPRPPKPHEVPAPGDNLLFYHHIRKYAPDAYLAAVLAALDHGGEPPTRLERMYAEQIVACARIADRKFAIFRFAIWVTICGLVTPLVALALYGLTHRSGHVSRRTPGLSAAADAAPLTAAHGDA